MTGFLTKYINVCAFVIVVLSVSPLSYGQGLSFSVHAGVPAVVGTSIILNARILEELKIEGKLGIVIGDEEYAGSQGIINVIYYPGQKLYLIAGITNHWNSGVSAISTNIASGSFILGGIGLGLDLTKAFSVEMVYSVPLKDYNIKGTWNFEKQQIEWSNMDNVLRIDLKFTGIYGKELINHFDIMRNKWE